MEENRAMDHKARRIATLTALIFVLATAAAYAQADSSDLARMLNQAVEAGAGPGALWNLGNTFFRENEPTAETARAAAEGYAGVGGRNEDQTRALRAAEAYWRERAEHFDKRFKVISEKDRLRRENPWLFLGERRGNLGMFPPAAE